MCSSELLFLYSLYTPFCEALPELDIQSESLPKTLTALLRAEVNNLVGGQIYIAVERLAAKSPDTANALYYAFLEHPDEPVSALIANVLRSLATFDFSEAHRRAVDLTTSQRRIVRRAGIAALGSFTYLEGDQDGLLQSTLTHLATLRMNSDSSLDDVLVRAYGDLLSHTQEVKPALVELSLRSDPNLQYQMAFVLSCASDEFYKETWFKKALLNLASVASEYTGTFGYLDHCATKLLKDDPEAASAFIEQVVLSRQYGGRKDGAKFLKLLASTFAALYQSYPAVLEVMITRWFASGDRQLHRAARDIIMDRGNISPHERSPVLMLSKPILDELDEEIVGFVVKRILGHVVSGHSLAALLLSALQRSPCPSALSEYITYALSDYVLYNYPGEAGIYLKNRIKENDVAVTESEVVQAALDRANAYVEARKGLPPLKELQPTFQHVYLLRLARYKQQAAMMEVIEQQSVFRSLAHRSPLKYGQAFFFEQNGTFSEPTPLHSFEHSIEIPRGELINPVGQAYQRFLWQSAGMEDATLETDEETEQED